MDRPEEEPILIALDCLRRCPEEVGEEFWQPDTGKHPKTKMSRFDNSYNETAKCASGSSQEGCNVGSSSPAIQPTCTQVSRSDATADGVTLSDGASSVRQGVHGPQLDGSDSADESAGASADSDVAESVVSHNAESNEAGLEMV